MILGSAGTRVLTGRGAISNFADAARGRRTLVVASAAALRRSGLDRRLPAGARVFSDFTPNPELAQAVHAAALRREISADLVVGLGGGSALDVAKGARALPPDLGTAEAIVAGQCPPEFGSATLLAIPTTAGTGSEVTRFATFYNDGRKVSLDADGVQADTAIVDPALTDSCPPDLTWCCAFDTLAHAVESIWSTRSTARSRALAEAALTLLVPVLRDSGRVPDRAGRDDLSTAATFAGQAIDITRTTAAHALSYPLTSHLGVAHGHACALHLIWLAPLVEHATDEEIADARGPGPVRSAVGSLRRLLGTEGRGLGGTIHDLVARSGLAAGLDLPPGDAQHLVSLVVHEGLASNRMAGMPVKVDRERAAAAVANLLGAGPEARSFGH